MRISCTPGEDSKLKFNFENYFCDQGSPRMGGVHHCWASFGPDGSQVMFVHYRHLIHYHSFNGQIGSSLFTLLSKKSLSSREGLPLTMKSCFYPLIGDRIFGWPGDLVDILRCSTLVNRLNNQRFIYFLASVWLRLFLACAQVLVLVLCRSTEACIFSTPLYPWILVSGLT